MGLKLVQWCQVDITYKSFSSANNLLTSPLWKLGLGNPAFTEVCLSGKAIDIEGGCHAYLAKDDHEYTMVFQPGYNTLVGVSEHNATSGIDTDIVDNFNKAKLFCKLS